MQMLLGQPSMVSQMLGLLANQSPAGQPGQPMPEPARPMNVPHPHQNLLGTIHDFIQNKMAGGVPAEYQQTGLLSQEEMQGAKPGIMQMLSHGGAYRQNLDRLLEMKGLAEKMGESRRIKGVRENMEKMFEPKPDEDAKGTFQRLEKMFGYAVQHGDMETADRLKGVMANLALPTHAEGPHNPIVGSPEWKDAEAFKASLRKTGQSEDRTLVQTQLPDGSVVYTKREDAAGMNAPSPLARGSAAITKSVAENKTQIQVIDEALRDLAEHPDAVGLKRGVGELVPGMGNVGDAINQRTDPKGVLARAGIMDIGSLKIKDRSGAAVTISEFPRLAPFVPRVSDTPEAVRTKLTRLKHFISIETDLLAASVGRQQTPAAKPKRSADDILSQYLK